MRESSSSLRGPHVCRCRLSVGLHLRAAASPSPVGLLPWSPSTVAAEPLWLSPHVSSRICLAVAGPGCPRLPVASLTSYAVICTPCLHMCPGRTGSAQLLYSHPQMEERMVLLIRRRVCLLEIRERYVRPSLAAHLPQRRRAGREARRHPADAPWFPTWACTRTRGRLESGLPLITLLERLISV